MCHKPCISHSFWYHKNNNWWVVQNKKLLVMCGCLDLQLPWLRFFCAFSSVVRQMPG
jgi:hypothetical protein